MKIELRSFTDPAVFYQVNTDAGTCSCNTFVEAAWCEHLIAVGQYKPRKVTFSARPSYAQALSAVVKSIRVRDINTGAYWLKYCWDFRGRLTGSQFRTVRRLLIGSGEDGHSVSVMEKVADNFSSLLHKDVEFEDVLTELVRICKVPNWFDPRTGGSNYIFAGMVASRRTLYDQKLYSFDHCLAEIRAAIDRKDAAGALFWMIKAEGTAKDIWTLLARSLAPMATERNNEPAWRLLTNVHLRHAKALSSDNNFLGQAIWHMAGGYSPVVDRIDEVTHEEVGSLLGVAINTPPYAVPSWCCDGIHCAGNDVRYSGIWDRMYAVCNQFSHYGRVTPIDPWLEHEFYSLDGLFTSSKTAPCSK